MSIIEHLQLMLEASALGKNFFEQKYKNSPIYNKVNELVNKEFTKNIQGEVLIYDNDNLPEKEMDKYY